MKNWRARVQKKRKVRGGRKGRRYGKRKNSTGYLKLVRKLPEMFVNNTATAGLPIVVDSTTNCLQIGTPVATSWGTYDIPFSLQFMLTQILNSTDITNFADRYRIKSAIIRIFFNSSNSSTGSLYSMPQVYHINDHDDSAVPTPSQVREKMGVKYKTFKNSSSYVGLRVNPVPARAMYLGTGFTAYEVPKVAPWINSTYNNTPHYGVKGVLTNVNLPSTSTSQIGFKFDVSLVVEAKDFQ